MVQLKVIIEVLGEWPKELDFEMNKIFSSRSSYFLKRMQKAVILRTVKVIVVFRFHVLYYKWR